MLLTSHIFLLCAFRGCVIIYPIFRYERRVSLFLSSHDLPDISIVLADFLCALIHRENTTDAKSGGTENGGKRCFDAIVKLK